MKILLVEDDQKIGQLIATGLEQKAHQVVWVQDGHKAWELLNGVPIDVLITDWKLPDLSGTELVQKLRRDERLGQLPVLMMSGGTDKSEIVAAIKAGINGLVVKPFTVAQLLEKIAAVLQGSETSLEEQIQALCRGLTTFERQAANPLVVFGEPDNTATALARPHRRESANYLVRAVDAINQANDGHPGLELGYVIDTNIKDVLLRTTRQDTRDRVKLVLCAVECAGNRALLIRLLNINKPGARSAFLVCDDYRQIPDDQRADFEKLGIDVFERKYLNTDVLHTLIEGHVAERLQQPAAAQTTSAEAIGQRLMDDLDNLTDLPTLPQVYHRIMQLALNSNSDLKDWVEAIRLDPMSSAIVVLHARSPAYGFQSDVNDIDRAVVLLGKRTVKDLVANEAVKRAFSTVGEMGFSLEEFWFHNASVAFAAHLLSFPLDEEKWNSEMRRQFNSFQLKADDVESLKRINLPVRLKFDRAQQDPFIAALMHDIGKAAMIQAYPGLFPLLIEEMENASWSKPMLAAEEEVAGGVTHTAVGEVLAKKWGLGNALCQVVKNHHRIGKKPGLTFLVGLADVIGQALYPFPQKAKSPLAAALRDGQLKNAQAFLPEGFAEQKFIRAEDFLELARILSPAAKRLTTEMWASVSQV